MSNQRNLILAVLLSGVLLFGWEAVMRHFYPHMNDKPVAAAQSAPAPAASDSANKSNPTREGGLSGAVALAQETQSLQTALVSSGRVPIAAPGLMGSINLAGAVVDDLTVTRHRATLDKNSGPVRIFSPAGTPAQQFAQFGWTGTGADMPNGTTVWTAPAGAKLTPQSPLTLSWNSPSGLTFTLTFAIDQDYMITTVAGVENHGAAAVTVQPFALINRTEHTASIDSWNIHSGPFGAFDDKVSFAPKYKDVQKDGQLANAGKANWLGFTDIYWMSTLIPDANPTTSDFRATGDGIYRADLLYASAPLAPGETLSRTTRLFAGAKESEVLDRYEATGIQHFGLAIDWGWFRWFEKPIFWLLKNLFKLSGNFGVAIILLTVIVRGIMFPVAQKQFASMAAMRALQPKMKALQERHKEDRSLLQSETMKLYKEEGANPLSGCLPIFLQIPVFFALYKVLMVSIDMRHQPFVLWIKDLSAPDPMHIVNLFGLLHFEPPSFLGIGILAVILGATMFFQFKLNPAAMDPAQQQVMAIMPWMMMFVMASFATGLLIYWITSNCLTMAQQAFLYSRHPQLKAQADKDQGDVNRIAARKKS